MKQQQIQQRDRFIEQLVNEAAHGTRRYLPQRLMWGWGLLCVVLVIASLGFTGPFRAGWETQILSSLRFACEMVLGGLTVASLVVLAFRSAVPGSILKSWVLSTGVLFVLWLLMISAGFYDTGLEASMAGKRAHCAYEIFIFGIPPVIIGGFLLMRGYVLNGWLSGLAIGLAAGMTSAMFMQLACMYAPLHSLLDHLLPGLVLGIVSAVAGGLLQARRS